MPLYTFRCSNGHQESVFAKIIERDDIRQCPRCGANLLRQFEAPSVRGDITPYQSPVTGQWIDSKRQRREDLKRSGCVEWEPGIRQDMPRRQQERLEAAFATVEPSIDEAARQLVAAGKLDPL